MRLKQVFHLLAVLAILDVAHGFSGRHSLVVKDGASPFFHLSGRRQIALQASESPPIGEQLDLEFSNSGTESSFIAAQEKESRADINRWRRALPGYESSIEGLDRLILSNAIPSMINLAVVPLVNSVDTFWVGRMGVALALAGRGDVSVGNCVARRTVYGRVDH